MQKPTFIPTLLNNIPIPINPNFQNLQNLQNMHNLAQLRMNMQANNVNLSSQVDPPRQSIIYPKDNTLNEQDTKVYELSKEEELRIEVGKNDTIRIIVESGYVEIEGAELPLNYVLTFSYTKLAIFCWSNAKIKVEGRPQSIYNSQSNKYTMYQYLMVHNIINEKRNEALIKNKIGPKILITGSSFCGKTTICRILLNYALKFGWTPLYVDLDPSNDISVPGTISAVPVDYCVPNDFLIDSAITLFVGSNLGDLNLYLYDKQLNEMANLVKSKLEFDLEIFKKKYNLLNLNNQEKININEEEINVNSEHPNLFSSGVIIHCPMIPASKDDSIYQTIIEGFEVDMVFIIENEKLYNVIKNINEKKFTNKEITVSLLQKTQGINQDPLYREYLDQNKFDCYFKGPFNNLKITEFKIDLNQYKLLQIIFSNVTSALLPIGSISDLNILLREVNLEENLLNRIVAIVHLDDKVINDLDSNYDKKLNSYVDHFARAPISFLAYM